MRLHHMLIAAPLAIAGCHGGGPKETEADHGWIRLAAVPGRPAAAYLRVHGGAQPTRMIAVDSDLAGSSELHQSMKDGTMAAMKRIDGVDVPANGDLIFAPGGYHVMLFGIGPKAKPGGRAKLTLRFAKGPALTIDARLVGAGDPAPY